MGIAVSLPIADGIEARRAECACASGRGSFEARHLAENLSLERRHAQLRRVEQVRELLTRLVLRGDSLEMLSTAVSELLGRPVAIRPDAPFTSAPGTLPIEAGVRVLGIVQTSVDGGPLSEEQQAILEQAAVAAAMHLLAEGSPRWTQGRSAVGPAPVRGGTHADDRWVGEWLATLPLAQDHPHLVLGLRCVEDAGDPRSGSDAVLAAVDHALKGRRLAGHCRRHGPEVVVVVQLADVRRAGTATRGLVEHIASLLRLAGASSTVSTGIGTLAHHVDQLPRRVEEARLAARLGPMLAGPGATTEYRDLRAFPAMIDALTGGGDGSFNDLHDRYLGALVEYETRTGLPLVRTLAALFDDNGNVSGAARSLGINRQSLLYRLRKIETLCEADLADPADRFALELAVRSWNVRCAMLPGLVGQGTDEAQADVEPRGAGAPIPFAPYRGEARLVLAAG